MEAGRTGFHAETAAVLAVEVKCRSDVHAIILLQETAGPIVKVSMS